MDPFQILGLSADASLKEIRRALHRLSLQWHPDKVGESSTLLFQHVNAAYGLLKSGDFDPGKKSSTEAPRRSSDFDNYTTQELFEDLLRDYMQARDGQEQARQHSSRSEKSSHGSGSEHSSDRSGMPREADGKEECPVCKQAPCKLFEKKKKPAEKHQAERLYRPIRKRRSAWPADSPGRRRHPVSSQR